MKYYSADLHLNHKNIIKYCNRPFTDTDTMNDLILRNIRETVTDNDDFYILGDFAFGNNIDKISSQLDQIPGRKHLIIGNHDSPEVINLPQWESTHDILEMIDGNTKLVLCHYPMISWNKIGKGAINVFGHVHNNWRGSSQSVNVGVDVFNFKPVTISEIVRRAKSLPELDIFNVTDPQRNDKQE